MQPYALDFAEDVEINGSRQNIRIRSRSLALPALLFLHGGPGVTDRHLVLKSCEQLTKSCTLVCWDQRDYLTRYGGGNWQKREGIVQSILMPLVKTPEYRLSELPGMVKGLLHSQEELVDEVVALDFFRDVPELKVPVILTEGRHDQNTPASIAHRWYDGLRAPKKQWIWFENSAHSPIHEEPERWCEEVRAALFGA